MLIHLLNVAMLTAGIMFASAIAIMDRDAATPMPIARPTGARIGLPSSGAINRGEPCATRPAVYSFEV
jgi:hypothetical protein